MKKYKSTDYLFASGCIKSLEKNLMTHEKMEKMLESKTPEDALKVLYELNYGDGSDEVSAAQFEKLLAQEHTKAYKTVMDVAPETGYFVVFLYPNDYHNLKTLLKAEFLGIEADDLLTDRGSIPLADLVDAFHNRTYSAMRDIMAQGVQEVLDTYGTTQDPQCVDLILDKACYADMNQAAAGMKNDFVKGYVALSIDTTNLKSFVRAREMQKPWDFFSKIYIEGGSISERTFINSYEEPLDQFAEKLNVYGLQEVLEEGAAMIKETGRFTALEKLCDNAVIDYVKDAKYIPYGLQPLVGYIVAKENEIKTARIIMAGKLAGISPDLLRERVRNTYA